MKGETYEQFVEKFKPKRTTDDCYTPPQVYETVLKWVRENIPQYWDNTPPASSARSTQAGTTKTWSSIRPTAS